MIVISTYIIPFVLGWVAGMATALYIGYRARQAALRQPQAFDVNGLAASIVQELEQIDRESRLAKEARRG